MSGSYRSSRPEVFCKKYVLGNFAKFIGKYLCQGLFFNKVAGLGEPIFLLSQNFVEKLLCCQIIESKRSIAQPRLLHGHLNNLQNYFLFGNSPFSDVNSLS